MSQSMKIIIALIFTTLLLCSAAAAQRVSIDQAKTVAGNWITTVINARGNWGGSPAANVAEVAEIKRGDRTLGYFCRVKPSGHIVVSLIEGLAPVKFFSETSSLDPGSDEGPADLLKFQLERRLDVIEKRSGSLSAATAADIDELLVLNYKDVWRQLLTGPLMLSAEKSSEETSDDYVEGQVLLASRWNQFYPYNILCPVPPPEVGCSEPNCATGCTATAGAQIMRYWSWPQTWPWLDMPDGMKISPTATEIEAVSELSYAVGLGVQMQYCHEACASSAGIEEMANYFDGVHFNPSSPIVWRYQYEWYQWYDMIMSNLNQNRPMFYVIKKHAIVCDGWWSTDVPMYHMNYGWGGSYDGWYVFDDLYQPDPEGTPAHEGMLHEIYPIGVLGPTVSGTVPAFSYFPHRYVDRDCAASSADFEAGQLIQFLPYMRLSCASGFLRFNATPALNTRLYTGEYSRGIRINDGQLVMYEGGSVKFRLTRPD